jgi:hypothetical protein
MPDSISMKFEISFVGNGGDHTIGGARPTLTCIALSGAPATHCTDRVEQTYLVSVERRSSTAQTGSNRVTWLASSRDPVAQMGGQIIE